MKKCLIEKRAAFVEGDMALFKEKQAELSGIIKRSKQQHRHKMEGQCIIGDAKKAWSSLPTDTILSQLAKPVLQ